MTHASDPAPQMPSDGWHDIASGDIGDNIYWEQVSEVLEQAEDAIGLVENLDSKEIA
jgi:hypothetical protein